MFLYYLSWFIQHWHLQSTSVILRQGSVHMKARTWSPKASFAELHYSSCNTALHTKPRLCLFFFSKNNECLWLSSPSVSVSDTGNLKKKTKNPFLFLCLCISTCAKRKHVWTLLCSLLRSYLKHEVSSFLLAIMVSYLRHLNYLLIALFSVLEIFFVGIFFFDGGDFLLFYKVAALKIITCGQEHFCPLILKGPLIIL